MTGGAASKRKGSQFERDIAAYLREHGFPDAERAYGAGRPEDIGDVVGIPGITVECKACRTIDLAGFVDEAERERLNARQPYAVAIVKRRNKGVDRSYVVMDLEAFSRLMAVTP
jgi:Holliday junction resolvase